MFTKTLKGSLLFFQQLQHVIICFLFIFITSFSADAAKVLQQRDSKILIEVESTDQIFVNQRFLVINSQNKRVALGTVSQVRNNRAILNIEKGQYVSPSTLRFLDSTTNQATTTSNEADDVSAVGSISDGPISSRGVYRVNSNKFSLVATMISSNMVTKQTDGANPVPNTEEVTLKGSSFGFTGIMDFPINDWLALRGTLGYEPFNVEGSSRFLSCDKLTSTNCNAYINYMSTGGYLRFDLTKGRSLVWLGVGGTLKYPISKKTTALLAEDIKTTMTYGVAAGWDYFINNKNFIPLSAEYQMFQSSDTVKANLILLRAGYGWAF